MKLRMKTNNCLVFTHIQFPTNRFNGLLSPKDYPPACELILIIEIETIPEISAADREGQVLTVRKSESSDADPAIENPTLELSSG